MITGSKLAGRCLWRGNWAYGSIVHATVENTFNLAAGSRDDQHHQLAFGRASFSEDERVLRAACLIESSPACNTQPAAAALHCSTRYGRISLWVDIQATIFERPNYSLLSGVEKNAFCTAVFLMEIFVHTLFLKHIWQTPIAFFISFKTYVVDREKIMLASFGITAAIF